MIPIRINSLVVLAAVLTATFILAPTRCLAQPSEPITVHVEVPPKIYVGDAADLRVVINGSRNAEAPDLSTLRDCDTAYRGLENRMSSSRVTIINGRVESETKVTYAHVYTITPKHAGQLVIPALTLAIDGHPYTTSPVSIDVVEPTSSPDFKLEVFTSPSAAFVGQPINIKLIWKLGNIKELRGVHFSLPITGADHEILPGPDLRPLHPSGQGLVQIGLNDEQLIGEFDGDTVTIDRVVIPRAAGVINLGPARADFVAVVGHRPREPFDPFADTAILDRQFSVAPTLILTVENLPTQGRPANFSGLIGNYQMTAHADATNIAVGDPINLALSVTGPHPLSLVPPLDIAHQSNLKDKFRLPREPSLPQLTPNAAIFQTMIRPRAADATEIGPISLTYFDPDARQYKQAATAPIPITVRASTSVTLPDQPDEEPTAPKLSPEKRPGGLPDIDRTPLSSGDPGLDLRTSLRSPATLATLTLPPLACLSAASFLAFRRWRDRDPAALRRRAALTQLHRSLRRSGTGSIDPVAHALSNFAADYFDQPRDAVTGADAASLLEQSRTPAGNQLADLIRACDESRFGASRTSAAEHTPASIIKQALAAARSFARELRGQRGAAA